MKACACLSLATSLSTITSDIYNMEQLITNLDNFMRNRIKNKKHKIMLHSELFGELAVTFELNVFSYVAYNGQVNIAITIESDSVDNKTFENKFKTDRNLIQAIYNAMSKWIDTINPEIAEIKFPKNEEVVYKDDCFYIKFNPNNTQHNVEWKTFEIYTDVLDNYSDIENNMQIAN